MTGDCNPGPVTLSGDVASQFEDLDPDDVRVETPLDPFDRLVLNPGRRDAEARNPVCPDCGEPIRPHANQHQRAFVCGCEDLRRFEFGTEEVPDDV